MRHGPGLMATWPGWVACGLSAWRVCVAAFLHCSTLPLSDTRPEESRALVTSRLRVSLRAGRASPNFS